MSNRSIKVPFTGSTITYGKDIPVSPSTKDVWLNTSNNKAYMFDGINWVAVQDNKIIDTIGTQHQNSVDSDYDRAMDILR